MSDDIRIAIENLSKEITSLRVALTGDNLGNKGLVNTVKDHIGQTEERYNSQLNWNNKMDAKLTRYVGIAAGLLLAFEVVSSVRSALGK